MTTTPLLHLQGIGKFYAIPAHELCVNDTLVWNYGGEGSRVAAIDHPSKCFIEITEHAGNIEGKRRLKTDRLVVVRQLVTLYSQEYRETRRNNKANPLSMLARSLEGTETMLTWSTLDRISRAQLYGIRDALQDEIRSR